MVLTGVWFSSSPKRPMTVSEFSLLGWIWKALPACWLGAVWHPQYHHMLLQHFLWWPVGILWSIYDRLAHLHSSQPHQGTFLLVPYQQGRKLLDPGRGPDQRIHTVQEWICPAFLQMQPCVLCNGSELALTWSQVVHRPIPVHTTTSFLVFLIDQVVARQAVWLVWFFFWQGFAVDGVVPWFSAQCSTSDRYLSISSSGKANMNKLNIIFTEFFYRIISLCCFHLFPFLSLWKYALPMVSSGENFIQNLICCSELNNKFLLAKFH